MNKIYNQLTILLVTATLSALTTSAAARQSFQGLGGLPGGLFFSTVNAVSDDGPALVGKGESPSDVEVYLWTSGGAWTPGVICSYHRNLWLFYAYNE